mgnify:CR=1 FL=1
MGLTLRDVTRHHDVEKLEPRIEELLRLGMLDHEVRHHCIEARECPHFGVVEGIGQEADVNHEIGLDGQAVFEAEREHMDIHELLVGQLGKSGLETLAQGGRAHAARIDDHVGSFADARKGDALTLDGICRGIALLREWMATTILTVPADEHLIGGLEEHDLAGHLMSSQ